jgi:hypothetical protein
MASSKQGGTAAAAQQLRSMSLGECAERKDNDDEPITKNGTNPTKLCSACGKKSDTLMKCRNCKCVWYCDKDCQNKHWKEHKKECKPIKKLLDERGGKLNLGTELDVGPLGKMPSREECPICMQVLPIHESLHTYFPCCGKTICCGCDYQHKIKSGKGQTCAFCREPLPKSDEEILARALKRVKCQDPHAMHNIAVEYGRGGLGLTVDQDKCIELLRESADLGYPMAHYTLGNFHHDGEMGFEQNEEKGFKYWEKAAEGGQIAAQHKVGYREVINDNFVVAIRHWRLSASGGLRLSMDNLIACFERGLLCHGDLAETLQVMYRSRAELKSDNRDQYIEYLKMTGEYDAEYDA